jgi:DHA2 family multidrug resistance protein
MSNAQNTIEDHQEPLKGIWLVLGGLVLALANFIVVLDTTIANVSISHISGGLAVSPHEGTYVITSYAVAEAITVPLTGWLVSRFGSVKVFSISMILFGVFSVMCGLAHSLDFLILARVFQGLSGGPLMPLSQALIIQIFPKERRGMALALWSMTTLIAPVLGPICGGYICDNWGWEFIFYINIPIALFCAVFSYGLLKRFSNKVTKSKIDFVGMGLLVVWVAALQIMLDEGKNQDWFESTEIRVLAIVSFIGFISFLIWELTHENPIVNLRVFRHRGFSASVTTVSFAFGAFFGTVVLTPLWLQSYMGYTATWSGFVTAATGVLAVVMAPVAAMLSQKIDPRKLVFIGVLWLGIMTYVRSFASTDMTAWDIAWPMLLQGVGLPLFFVPLTSLALASVDDEETASAAGIMNFLRTFSGAIATSVVTTLWDNSTTAFRYDLVERAQNPLHIASLMGDMSATGEKMATYTLDFLIQTQAVMLSTNHVMLMVAFTFAFAATSIWLAPKPTKQVDTSAVH